MTKEKIWRLDKAIGLFEEVKTNYGAVSEETQEQTGEKYSAWLDHFEIIHYIMALFVLTTDTLLPDKIKNSLLAHRIGELWTQIIWIWTCIDYGVYHSAIRELRFVFESVLKACYFDMGHPDSSIACKLEIIKELETIETYLIGNRLINLVGKYLNLSKTIKKQFKDLYSDLSKYVHLSYEELKSLFAQGELKPSQFFAFQSDLFNKCLDMMNETFDAAYFLFLNGFPEAKDLLKKNSEFKNSLKAVQCKLTLKHLDI